MKRHSSVIRNCRCNTAVGAVYDRPQCLERKIAGGHRPPLQWSIAISFRNRINWEIFEFLRAIVSGGLGACAILLLIALPSLAAQQDRGFSVLQQVRIDQRLGAAINLNLPFRDESGNAVRLGDFFHGKPVILAPVYYTCSSLCPMTLNSLVQSLRVLTFNTGREFEVVAFSFDPKETPATAAEAKAHYVRDYNRPNTENGWHFLAGNDTSIRTLTNSLGFHYVWDADSGQWAHATAIIVATPEGKVGQYFYGLEFSARDLRLSLVQASSEKIGTLADRVLLYCYHYDPATGKYGMVVIRTVRIFGTLTALTLFGFMFLMFRRDSRTMRGGRADA